MIYKHIHADKPVSITGKIIIISQKPLHILLPGAAFWFKRYCFILMRFYWNYLILHFIYITGHASNLEWSFHMIHHRCLALRDSIHPKRIVYKYLARGQMLEIPLVINTTLVFSNFGHGITMCYRSSMAY